MDSENATRELAVGILPFGECDCTWKGRIAPEVGIDMDEIEKTFEDGS